MSWVLNAIVTWDILEDTSQRLAEVNAPLAASHGQKFANTEDDDFETRHAEETTKWWRKRRSKRPARWYGGPKYMEATFFGAAFNHVPPAAPAAPPPYLQPEDSQTN